jgi:translation elongation factor EF-1beta
LASAPLEASGYTTLAHVPAVSSGQPWRCEFEVLPADDSIEVASIFETLSTMSLSGVEWLSCRSEPLFHGINKLLIICKVDDGCNDDVLSHIQSLSTVQSARLLCMSAFVSDSFEICSRLFTVNAQTLGELQLQCCTSAHVKQLLHQGFTVLDDFVAGDVANDAARVVGESLTKYPDLGHDGIQWRFPEPRTARSDVAVWLTPGQRPATDVVFAEGVLPAFERLKGELCSILSLQGLGEHQLAWYPAESSGYKRHTDAMADDCPTSSQRKVTAILYCNPGWVCEDGGALRLWLPDHLGAGSVDVEPVSGRLLLFLAGCIQHEVRPSYNKRCAVTCWYF